MLVAEPFLIFGMLQERCRRQNNGYGISWMTDKWKWEKWCAKLCFFGMKERLFCIGSWLKMKNRSISRTQNEENHGLTQDQPSTSSARTAPLWKEENAVHWVGSEECRVSWSFKTRWNSQYHSLLSTNNQLEPGTDRKETRHRKVIL